ncbi:MAG: hypothetical protein D6706_13345 [Chloroflexi bacterium]|nr:MAG: hypothetical protein D6706_13345 [Chloroflexota bacterium]
MKMMVKYQLLDANGQTLASSDLDASGSPSTLPGAIQARTFAQNITQHYDDLAAMGILNVTRRDANNNNVTYNPLKKLKRLGKIVAVLRWLKENNIPIDLSFMEGYTPKKVNTKSTVNLLQLCADANNTILRTGNGAFTPGTMPAGCRHMIIGGVRYGTPNTVTAAAAAHSARIAAALKSKPTQTQLSSLHWISNTNDVNAQTLAQSHHDGGMNFSRVDLALPGVRGESLNFTRYYNSFLQTQNGLGKAWSALPYTLNFPESKAVLCPQPLANAQRGCTVAAPDTTKGDPATWPDGIKGPNGAIIAFNKIYLTDHTVGGQAQFHYVKNISITRKTDNVTYSQPLYLSDDSNDVIYVLPPTGTSSSGGIVYEQRNTNNETVKTVFFTERPTDGLFTTQGDPVAIVMNTGNGLSNGANAVTTLSYIYDTSNRLIEVNAPGVGATAGQHSIHIEYGANNRISRVWYGSSDGMRETRYAYNASGYLDQVTQSNGSIIRYTYQTGARLDGSTYVSNLIDTITDVTRNQILYSSTNTQPDILDRVTQYQAENNPNLRTTATYDSIVDATNKQIGSRMTVVDGLGRTSLKERDVQNRMTSTKSTALVNGASTTLTMALGYNTAANANPLWGPTRVSQVERGANTQYTYDSQGHVASITDALGRTTSIDRGVDATDNLPMIVTTDPKGRISAVKYDTQGRVVKQYRRISSTGFSKTLQANSTDRYTFTFTVPSVANTQTIVYDDPPQNATNAAAYTGDVKSINTGGDVVQIVSRDAFGQPTQVATAAGYRNHYTYDGLARIKTMQSAKDVKPVSVNYYENTLAQDQVSQVSSAVSSTTVSYDVVNRTTTTTDSRGVKTTEFRNIKNQLTKIVQAGPDGNSLTTQYFYDDYGRLIYKILPNQTRVDYTYDGFNRLEQMKETELASTTRRPSITASPAANTILNQGGALNTAITATGTGLSYSLINAPAGMTIDATGKITWTPGQLQAGTYVVIAQVSNGSGGVATAKFTVVVTDTAAGVADNCPHVTNPKQRDTDKDGFGNLCDPDLDQNNIVNYADLALLKGRFGSFDATSDFNDDGIIDNRDLDILKSYFGQAPGSVPKINSGVTP